MRGGGGGSSQYQLNKHQFVTGMETQLSGMHFERVELELLFEYFDHDGLRSMTYGDEKKVTDYEAMKWCLQLAWAAWSKKEKKPVPYEFD